MPPDPRTISLIAHLPEPKPIPQNPLRQRRLPETASPSQIIQILTSGRDQESAKGGVDGVPVFDKRNGAYRDRAHSHQDPHAVREQEPARIVAPQQHGTGDGAGDCGAGFGAHDVVGHEGEDHVGEFLLDRGGEVGDGEVAVVRDHEGGLGNVGVGLGPAAFARLVNSVVHGPAEEEPCCVHAPVFFFP